MATAAARSRFRSWTRFPDAVQRGAVRRRAGIVSKAVSGAIPVSHAASRRKRGVLQRARETEWTGQAAASGTGFEPKRTSR